MALIFELGNGQSYRLFSTNIGRGGVGYHHRGVIEALFPLVLDGFKIDIDAVADVASQIADGDLNVYEGPVVDSSGTERVAAGSSLDSVEAYNIGYAVEGVSGL